MQDLIKKYYRINNNLYKAAKVPLRSHGPDHHYRVCRNALQLARQYPKADREILVVAAFLHDLAAYYPEQVGDNYHQEDYQRAARVLRRVKFNPAKIPRVLQVIARHGSDSKDKSEPIEVTLLRDADKLDAFGEVGVARIIMVRTLQGDTIRQIVDDFYTNKHLERKWRSITTPQAKCLGKSDYKYALNFFKKLAKNFR